MSPRTQVGRRLLPPIFLPNIGHNQSASRIIALTFLTKNGSNESAFFVQRAHPYRAVLLSSIRINFRVPSSLTVPRVPTVPIALTVPISLRVPSSLKVPTRPRVSYGSHSIQKSDSSYSSHGPKAPIALTLSSKNNPSLRYLYLKQRRYYFVWLYKVLEIYIFYNSVNPSVIPQQLPLLS